MICGELFSGLYKLSIYPNNLFDRRSQQELNMWAYDASTWLVEVSCVSVSGISSPLNHREKNSKNSYTHWHTYIYIYIQYIHILSRVERHVFAIPTDWCFMFFFISRRFGKLGQTWARIFCVQKTHVSDGGKNESHLFHSDSWTQPPPHSHIASYSHIEDPTQTPTTSPPKKKEVNRNSNEDQSTHFKMNMQNISKYINKETH